MSNEINNNKSNDSDGLNSRIYYTNNSVFKWLTWRVVFAFIALLVLLLIFYSLSPLGKQRSQDKNTNLLNSELEGIFENFDFISVNFRKRHESGIISGYKYELIAEFKNKINKNFKIKIICNTDEYGNWCDDMVDREFYNSKFSILKDKNTAGFFKETGKYPGEISLNLGAGIKSQQIIKVKYFLDEEYFDIVKPYINKNDIRDDFVACYNSSICGLDSIDEIATNNNQYGRSNAIFYYDDNANSYYVLGNAESPDLTKRLLFYYDDEGGTWDYLGEISTHSQMLK
ncbi:MAG: hypothetical protein HGB12_10760 [Bacteroidetes bacterium]|nr:hypothetical protein [Bacteroidota bacterium]